MNLFWLYEWHWHSFQLGREGETERECVRESESDGREWGCECECGRERMGCERLREREKERERENNQNAGWHSRDRIEFFFCNECSNSNVSVHCAYLEPTPLNSNRFRDRISTSGNFSLQNLTT